MYCFQSIYLTVAQWKRMYADITLKQKWHSVEIQVKVYQQISSVFFKYPKVTLESKSKI